MSVKLKSIVFIAVLCVVCSLILTFGATALKAPQERNALLDRQKHILRAAGLMPAEKIPANQALAIYNAHIAEFFAAYNGSLAKTPNADHLLRFYAAYNDEGQVEQVILPFTVQGVWGPISGYLALNTNLRTVTGFTVYDSAETAGLGAQIAQSWFTGQWRGKQLYDDEGQFRSIIVAKGQTRDDDPLFNNTVDGISGATLTGNALYRGLAQYLAGVLPYLAKIDWTLANK